MVRISEQNKGRVKRGLGRLKDVVKDMKVYIIYHTLSHYTFYKRLLALIVPIATNILRAV